MLLYVHILISKQHFQGGVNHFEDGPEAPIEVKLILIKLKMPQRLVGVFAHVKAGVSLFPGDSMDGEDSGGQVNTFGHPYYCEVDELIEYTFIFSAVFVWDLENEIGFSYVPTYLAW